MATILLLKRFFLFSLPILNRPETYKRISFLQKSDKEITTATTTIITQQPQQQQQATNIVHHDYQHNDTRRNNIMTL